MKRHVLHIILSAVMVMVAGCSTTKRLGANDVLYTGVKKIAVESTDGEKVPSSVESAVKGPLSVKPNNPLYSPYIRTPFPGGLLVWNYFYTERQTGFRSWIFRTLGKAPVLISQVQPDLRTRLVEDILDNHGYFGSEADFELLPQSNPKKARLSYRVDVADPWMYGSVEFPTTEGPVTQRIKSLQESSNIKTGEQYNIDTLTRERIRIANILREESYYYFRPDHVEYLADTTRQPLTIDLRMVMTPGIPPAAVAPYNIGNVTVSFLDNPESITNRDKKSGDRDRRVRPDTMEYAGIRISYQEPLKLRPKIMARALTIAPGMPARISDINTTLNNLTKLGIFSYVNMEVTPLDSLRAGDPLDMKITAEFDKHLSAEFEVDFTHKSSSFIGPGATFSVTNKNFLHGGEVLSLKLNGSYEWQTGNTSSEANSTTVNSYELGANTSLMFPRLVAPGIFRRNSLPTTTTYNLGGGIMNRPRFFRMLSLNVSASYDFHTSPGSSHNLTLFRMVYNRLLKTEPSFEELMTQNPTIRMSFENQFVPSASYTYTWNQRLGTNRADQIIWSSTVSTAGNIFAGAWSLFGTDRPYTIFNNRFSQFVKLTSEFKYFKNFNPNSTLAFRLFAGAGYAYGNSEVMPYSEQFYIGGANSIRAYTIRSLGPGSYRPDMNNAYGYFDQTGDFKLEANLEYRFGIVGGLKGAVFLDAGNIWLLKADPAANAENPNYTPREGGNLTFKNFFDNVATGTGAGLRYDLTFLVVRFDVGVGIHLPYETEKSGYYNIPTFKDGLGYHLAIGYPF